MIGHASTGGSIHGPGGWTTLPAELSHPLTCWLKRQAASQHAGLGAGAVSRYRRTSPSRDARFPTSCVRRRCKHVCAYVNRGGEQCSSSSSSSAGAAEAKARLPRTRASGASCTVHNPQPTTHLNAGVGGQAKELAPLLNLLGARRLHRQPAQQAAAVASESEPLLPVPAALRAFC